MGRSWPSVILVVLLLFVSTTPAVNLELDDSKSSFFTASDLSLSFSNGPTQNQDVTGLFSLSFSMSGEANVSSLLIELSSDGNTWTTVTNLTSTPWLTYFDSTSYSNAS